MIDVGPGPTALRNAMLPGENGESVAKRALQAVRSHLGLQIAYVSEFVGDESVFREVDAPGFEDRIKPGDRWSLDDVYCRHILAGRLPELMADTATFPFAAAMPLTSAVPIGAHISVPLRLPDGAVYGMFCCLGPHADSTLNQRDLRMMRAFADLAAFEIGRDLANSRVHREKCARIEALLEDETIDLVYQPIWSLTAHRPIGFECLSRFAFEPLRAPDRWFAEAAEVGKGVDVELLAIRQALAALRVLPDDIYLAVNASPETVLSPALAQTLAGHPLHRVVIEVTEHECVDDFASLADVLAPLRAQGLRLAVDDAGAGHSGLHQILQLRPDIIKLDRSLIHGIGSDPGRRALASALMIFARETGSRLVAEGVETEAELAMLRALGVDSVQGYLLGHPEPLDRTLALMQSCDRRASSAQSGG